MVERAERPQGPEQGLKTLFRDSNTNADDIMEEKKGKGKGRKSNGSFCRTAVVGHVVEMEVIIGWNLFCSDTPIPNRTGQTCSSFKEVEVP